MPSSRPTGSASASTSSSANRPAAQARTDDGGRPLVHDRVSVNALCFIGEPIEAVADHWRELAPRRVSLISYQAQGVAIAETQAVIDRAGYGLETVSHALLYGALTRPLGTRPAARLATSSRPPPRSAPSRSTC